MNIVYIVIILITLVATDAHSNTKHQWLPVLHQYHQVNGSIL